MASRNHIHWVWYQPQVPLGERMGKLGNKVEVTLIDQYSPKRIGIFAQKLVIQRRHSAKK